MEDQGTPTSEPLDRIDLTLAMLTLPLLLCALMFAVTGVTELLATRRKRRRIGLALLAFEAVLITVIVMSIR